MHSNHPRVIQGNFVSGHPTFAVQARPAAGFASPRQAAHVQAALQQHTQPQQAIQRQAATTAHEAAQPHRAPHVQAALQQNAPHFGAVQRHAGRHGAVQPKNPPQHPGRRQAPQTPVVQHFGANTATQVPPGGLSLRPRSNGQRLPETVQRKMEAVFGADFSDVRIHVGPEAQQLGARAFTMGSSIYFAPGQYNPATAHGQRLLGHELAHVVQQKAGRVQNPFGQGIAVVQNPGLEAEAERMGTQVIHAFTRPGPHAAPGPSPSPPSSQTIQRSVLDQYTYARDLYQQNLSQHLREIGRVNRAKRAGEQFQSQYDPLIKQLEVVTLPEEVQTWKTTWYEQFGNENYLGAEDVRGNLQEWLDENQTTLSELLTARTRIADIGETVAEFLEGKSSSISQVRSVTDLWKNITEGEGPTLTSHFGPDRYHQWLDRIEDLIENYEVSTGTSTGSRHLTRFHSQTSNLRKNTSASTVFAYVRVNGSTVPTVSTSNSTIEQAIKNPDPSDPAVTNTQNDGEVGVLTPALKSFYAYLDKSRNQGSAQKFEVALSGAWGACDGCKKRIKKFADLWQAKAQSTMNTGVKATLKITYKYLNEAETFKRTWGKTTYGWSSDGSGNGPFFHTEDREVTGT